MQRDNKNSGNVLFLVLIAVALFAALSYAITQSGRGGGNVNKEQVAISAAQIVQYASSIDTAVQRLRLSGGLTETDINFENSGDAAYTNAGCSAATCKVFDPAGGGVTYSKPDTAWLDTSYSADGLYQNWHFTGRVGVSGVGTNGAVDSAMDLTLFLPFLTRDICYEINDRLGVSNPSGEPPVEASVTWPIAKFTGAYTYSSSLNVAAGEYSGCAEGGGTPASGTYYYWHVLIAR